MPSFEEVLDSYVDLLGGARILGIHPESLRRLIKSQGKLKGEFVVYRGKYLINREALLRFKSTYESRPGPKRVKKYFK